MSRRPSFLAYAVKDRGRNQKAIWTKIGAAWPHIDGKGYSIELDAVPLDGRLVLMEPKPDEPTDQSPMQA